MTYNSRRQATPSFVASAHRKAKASPRITGWDVLGLLALMCVGAWLLYQFSAALLLTTYAGAPR